jgi:peptide/nickel transport system substrate-binding protein
LNQAKEPEMILPTRPRAVLAAAALGLLATLASALMAAPAAHAQGRKDSVVLGMVLEPPGLDPTTAPAAAIGEIVHYNVLEGLTKVNVDGSVTPLLAESWSVSPDGRSYSFRLLRGVKFQDGEVFDAADVRFSFERARADGSTNKNKKAVFDNIAAIDTPDPYSVTVHLKNADGNFLFRMGESTAVILDPKSAAGAAAQPVGTGPFRLAEWKKGSSVTLTRWDGYRHPAAIKLRRATFRFINEPAAQVAAMLAGDVDGFPRFDLQSWRRFQGDKRFTVAQGSTAGKGILAINNRRKPFNDVRVRRAIMHAIDRRAFIDGVLDGLARPIGSHAAPTDAGYVDLTGQVPHDLARARALLHQAGVPLPLAVTLTLPPPQYARKGGEVIAAQLAQVGIRAKIENVEWAQWLSGAFKGHFDLTIINHVEPLDFMIYADPGYYFGYDSAAYRQLTGRYAAAADPKQRLRLYGDIQRRLAEDAVNAYLFNPAQVALARRGLKGLWASSPIFANDLSAVAWQ